MSSAHRVLGRTDLGSCGALGERLGDLLTKGEKLGVPITLHLLTYGDTVR